MMLFDHPLYLVTDSLNLTEAEFLAKIEAALAGGVDLLQLREKAVTSKQYYSRAQKVKRLTDQYQVPLIIDDRLDIAMAVDAAGVHLGEEDLDVATARKLLGPTKLIGATTKTVEQAVSAVEQGADYLGVGAIFPTTTHVKTVATSVETLTAIRHNVNVPVFAIGGLNQHNVATIKPAQVAGVAVVSAIMKANEPKKAAAQLRQQILSVIKQ